MKIFNCQACGQVLYFENTSCLRCGHALGYLPDRGLLSAVTAEGPVWVAMAAPETRYRYCANWELSACNWMLPADADDPHCAACRHNRTVPDLSDPENHARWQKIEAAKRRLMYSLIQFGLPHPAPEDGGAEPLAFDFLSQAEARAAGAEPVTTGHAAGLITIALEEADDAERERRRTNMNEPYRTLLGHFRHEVGHYYWDRLVRDGGQLEQFRALFGDERADYGAAMQRHYDQGAPGDWPDAFVSAYATMHPWEDWAETWAHYLHITDTLEMAEAFGISIDTEVQGEAGDVIASEIDFDPHRARQIAPLIDAWVPLSMAINALNRAMGMPDLYPFVLPQPVIQKLGFIQSLVQQARNR